MMDAMTMNDPMNPVRSQDRFGLSGVPHLLAGTVLAVSLLAAIPALSQSFERQVPSESIADSEISVEDTAAAEHIDDLMQSLETLPESIDRVKIITNMEKIDVAYLRDMVGEDAPAELETAIETNSERILELQKGLEASAIFYNALISRDVNIPDVVAIDLDEPNATIFVRGVAPDQAIGLDEAEGGSADTAPASDSETPGETTPAPAE